MTTQEQSLNQKGKGGLRFSLRTMLIVGAILLSIVPLALAGGYAISSASNQARQQVEQQMNSLADARLASLRISLAQLTTSLNAVLATSDQREKLVSLLTRADAETEESTLQAVQEDLAAFLQSQDDFQEYFLYNTEGRILASTSEQQLGKVVSLQPYFTGSLEGPHVQAPYYEVGSGSLTMIFSTPVVARNGRVVGVLAGRIGSTPLNELMTERSGLGQTGETYLVSLESSYFLTPSRFEGYSLTQSYHSQAIDAALAGQDGSGIYPDYRGISVVGAYRWVPDLQVALIAEIDEAEALQAATTGTIVSLLVALLAGTAAVAVGLLSAISITRPLGQLTTAARHLAEGDLNARANVTQRNEIGELSDTFNTMADRLSETLSALQASVREAQTATAMAREANRLKSEFLSTMSHELRTPLNAIIGFTEIFIAGMAGELTEKQMHRINRIHMNSARLLSLINDLLDLAKIEAGRVEVVWKKLEPRKLADAIAAQMESISEQRGLDFQVRVDPAFPNEIIGDSSRIEQIAKNLISNAFKFTKQGSVNVDFAMGSDETWTLSVSDTGIGIPPHALDFIFDEFRQVDGTSQRAYGGSGLGLSITRNLARIMGGEVHVTSVLGQGSTFTVSLPLFVEEADLQRKGVMAA